MEAAAELVVDPAVGHRVEREPHDGSEPGVVAGAGGAAGTRSSSAAGTSARRPSCRCAASNDCMSAFATASRAAPASGRRSRRSMRCWSTSAATSRVPASSTSVALLTPGPVDAIEDLPERRHPVARLVREVRAAVERPAVRRQEDAHRPAAAARHRLDGGHVDLVQVGPLLAVHLDRDEALVQVPRRPRVLERLALHDVAPVARRVADREEDRAIEDRRSRERIGSPREPVDRVVRVLQQVRAGLAGEAVGHVTDGTARADRTGACPAMPKVRIER